MKCSRCSSEEGCRDGFCKPCRREYDKARYALDKGIGPSASKWRHQEKWKVIQKAKDVSCKDCNEKYLWVAMVFDHVRGEKVKNVARLLASGSMQAMLDEIQKCEVVCASCHRVRKAKRAGWI